MDWGSEVRFFVCFFLAVITGCMPAYAEQKCPDVVHLTNPDEIVNLAQNIELITDFQSDEINEHGFTAHCADFIAFPAESTKTQIRFRLQNDTAKTNEWVIRLGGVFLESISLIDPALPPELRVIDHFPADSKSTLRSMKPALQVSLPPGQKKDLILEVHNTILPSAIASITSRENFDSLELRHVLELTIATGFFTGLIFITLFVGLSVRPYTSILYCGYLFSVIAAILGFHGMLVKFGLPGLYGETANYINSAFELSATVFMGFFLRRMLNFKENLPHFDKVPWIIAICSVLILVFFDYMPDRVEARIERAVIVAGTIVALIASFQLAKDGYRPAKILFISFTIVIVGLIGNAALFVNPSFVFGWFSKPIEAMEVLKIWPFQVTIMAEAGLISYAFSMHAREWKKDTETKLSQAQEQNARYQANINFVKAHAKISAPLIADGSLAEDTFLSQAAELVRKNVHDETFGVAALAAGLAVSDRSLRRKIKAAYDLSPTAYIQRERLSIAQELITKKAYTTANEIAYAVGYSSPSYFAKLYKQTFSITPADALRLEQNNL